MNVPARRTLIGTAWLCAAALVCGCNVDLPGKPDPADRPLMPAEIKDFGVLFAQNCAGCHGADGTLGPAPPLNDPLFLAIVPDEVLRAVITGGRPGTPMPAFARLNGGTLTDEQIGIIATGLKQHWKNGKLPEAPLPNYLAEGKTDSAELVAQGKEVFAAACASCHGDDGQGTGPGEPPGAVNDPALLALLSDQALRRIIITGRADLGMPNFAGDTARDSGSKPLDEPQIAALVALMAHWRAAGGEKASTAMVEPQR